MEQHLGTAMHVDGRGGASSAVEPSHVAEPLQLPSRERWPGRGEGHAADLPPPPATPRGQRLGERRWPAEARDARRRDEARAVTDRWRVGEHEAGAAVEAERDSRKQETKRHSLA